MVRIDRTIYPVPGETEGSPAGQKVILAIGGPELWTKIRPLPACEMRVTFTSMRDLDEAILQLVSPETVISPVVSKGFDCLDVAQRLSFLGYLGPVRAVSPRVIETRLIRREVHALCPALDFDILALDRDGALAL